MKVLVSAFKPFNKQPNNYSIEVLNYLENVTKQIVDVCYDKCYMDLCGLHDLSSYDLIIALGEARSRSVLTLETKAYNLSSCSLKDNAGVLKQNCIINENENEVIESKVDFNKAKDIVKLSNDPGRFVCNNLYFHLLTNYPEKSLFIHIPECNNDKQEYIKHAKIISEIINRLTKEAYKGNLCN